MKSEPSRTAKSLQLKEPDIVPYDSQCSCDKCDSFNCFALRYKSACPCEMCNTKVTESKFAEKTYPSTNAFRIDVSHNESLHKEHVKKEITYDDSITVKTVEPTYTRASETSEVEISRDKAHVNSVTALSSNDLDSTTEKLSAQVMNVPYRDLKVLHRNKVSRSTPKLTSLDILKRIKEAYDACTCKVCECIAGITAARNVYCNCTPCNCKDCLARGHNLRFDGTLTQANEGCPCIRCDRKKECKGVISKTLKSCDCDLFEDTSKSLNNPCNCKPCECIECKSYLATKPNRIIIGQMNVNTPSYCSCSPCDCATCVQSLSTSSSLQHEIATSISRPTNCTCQSCMSEACESNDTNTCSCEVQRRVMRKPVEKDTYGIHRALVMNYNCNSIIENVKSSTLAMFAAIGHTFPKIEQDSKPCDCAKCECLICNRSNRIANRITSSTFKEPLHTEPVLLYQDSCKCMPCECEVCTENNGQNIILNNFTKCACDTCVCLDCDRLISKKRCGNDNKPSGICKYKLYKYYDCKSTIPCRAGENYSSECVQNKCSNHNPDLNKFSIYRTKLLEGNYSMESINNTTSAIRSVTVIKTSTNTVMKESEITISSTTAPDLISSLRRANSQLDAVYNKSKYISNRVKESNNNEGNKSYKTKNNNTEPMNDKHNVNHVIDVDKLKYSLKQAELFSLELTKLLRQYENANKDTIECCASFTEIQGSGFNVGFHDNITENTSSEEYCENKDMGNIKLQLKRSQSDHNEILEMYNSFSGYMISGSDDIALVEKGSSNNCKVGSKLHITSCESTEILHKSYEPAKREYECEPDEQFPCTLEVFPTDTNPQGSVSPKVNVMESGNNKSPLASTQIEDRSQIGFISEITQSSLKTVDSNEDVNGISIFKKNTTLCNSPFRKPKSVCVIPKLEY